MARRRSVYNEEPTGCGSRMMVWAGWLVILAIAYLAGAYAIGPYMQHYILGNKPEVTTTATPTVPTAPPTLSAPTASSATQPNTASTVTSPGIVINSAPNNNPAPHPQINRPVASPSAVRPRPIIHPKPPVQSNGILQRSAPISGQSARPAVEHPPVQKHHHRVERPQPSAPPAKPNLQQPETPQSPLNF